MFLLLPSPLPLFSLSLPLPLLLCNPWRCSCPCKEKCSLQGPREIRVHSKNQCPPLRHSGSSKHICKLSKLLHVIQSNIVICSWEILVKSSEWKHIPNLRSKQREKEPYFVTPNSRSHSQNCMISKESLKIWIL